MKTYQQENIIIVKTKKFKKILFTIDINQSLTKENITKTSLLLRILLSINKKYNNNLKLNIKKEELYSPSIDYDYKIRGEIFNTQIKLLILEDQYTEKNNFKNSLKLLNSLLFNPLIKDNAFDEKIFNLYKKELEEGIKQRKEKPSTYSLIKTLEAKNLNYSSLFIYLYKDELDKITKENLYEFYTNLLSNASFNFFLIGNVNKKSNINLIKKLFPLTNKNLTNKFYKNIKFDKEIVEKKETINNKQSKVNIIYSFENISTYERNYVAIVLNQVIGASFSAILFNEIREKKSLCYTIYSYYTPDDSLMYILSGINNTDYEKYKKEVDKIINNLDKYIKPKLINMVKKNIIDDLKNYDEKQNNILYRIYDEKFIRQKNIKELIDNYKKVTKEDIISLGKKMKKEIIFMLEGIQNEKN